MRRDLPEPSVAVFEQAKSAPPKSVVFTNQGKAEKQERPIKPAKKLTRVPFKAEIAPVASMTVLPEASSPWCSLSTYANGVAHHIAFSVDHIKQEPRIEHTTRPSSVVRGTRITVELPPSQ
jgi:hypothetical protein